MFNYLGKVVGPHVPTSSPQAPAPTNFGLVLLDVTVPAVSSSRSITAAVLTFPGIVTNYQPGDTVLIGELEQADDGDIRFFILGKLQTTAESTGQLTSSLARISSSEATLLGGTLAGQMKISASLTNSSGFQLVTAAASQVPLDDIIYAVTKVNNSN